MVAHYVRAVHLDHDVVTILADVVVFLIARTQRLGPVRIAPDGFDKGLVPRCTSVCGKSGDVPVAIIAIPAHVLSPSNFVRLMIETIFLLSGSLRLPHLRWRSSLSRCLGLPRLSAQTPTLC